MRIATSQFHHSAAAAIADNQRGLATGQAQLASGRRADTVAGSGVDASRLLTARAALAGQQAALTATRPAEARLDQAMAALTDLDGAMVGLRGQLLTALGNGDAAGVDGAGAAGFAAIQRAVNSKVGGAFIFAGSRSDTAPLAARSPADLAGGTPPDWLNSDRLGPPLPLGDGTFLPPIPAATDFAPALLAAIGALAEAGPFSGRLNDGQRGAVAAVVSALDSGLDAVRGANAAAGDTARRLSEWQDQAGARATLLSATIGDMADVDLGEVAARLAADEARLEASYAVFARLSRLSLADYLR